MCNELSGIFVRNPQTEELTFIEGRETRHHAAMIAMHKLKEGKAHQNFVKAEYTPIDGDWLNCAFKIDETNVPSWVTDEVRDRMVSRFEKFRDSLIVKGNVAAMLGGKYIVTGKCNVEWADNCVILVGTKAKLTIENVMDVVFGNVSGSVTTGNVSGSVKTGYVYGSVKTGYVSGSVTTDYVSGSGSVKTGYVDGSVTTGNVYGSVTTVSVSGSVNTGDVSGSGSVKTGNRAPSAIVCIGNVIQENKGGAK